MKVVKDACSVNILYICRVAMYLWLALKIEKFGVDKALKWSLMINILLWVFVEIVLKMIFGDL